MSGPCWFQVSLSRFQQLKVDLGTCKRMIDTEAKAADIDNAAYRATA